MTVSVALSQMSGASSQQTSTCASPGRRASRESSSRAKIPEGDSVMLKEDVSST